MPKRGVAVDKTRLWTTVRRTRDEGRAIIEGDIVFKTKCEVLHNPSIPCLFVVYGEVPGHAVIVDDAPSFCLSSEIAKNANIWYSYKQETYFIQRT